MKKILVIFTVAILVLSPFVSSSQTVVTLHESGTTTNFTSALICSGDASDNPKMLLTVSNLTPQVHANSGVQLDVVVRDWNNQVIKTKTLGQTTVHPPGNTGTTISWDIELGDNVIKSTITPNQGGTGSDQFDRIEGQYNFVIKWQDINSIPRSYQCPVFSIIEGHAPKIRITAANESIANWTADEKRFSILKGCVSNDPRLRLYPFQCGTDGIELWVNEKDPNTGAAIGTSTRRVLTTAEVNAMQSSAGFPINGFTDNSSTVNLTTGKFYGITVIYVGQGRWKANFASMSYKDGTWDLMIKDHYSDNGTEPVNGYDVFESPDLWNKKSTTLNKNTKSHEPPAHVTVGGNSNKLMVEVTNIGCAQSDPNIPLRMFWTRARTDELWKSHWLYDMTNNAAQDPDTPSIMRPLGSEVTIDTPSMNHPYSTNSKPYLLPVIAANGGTHKISFNNAVDWFPPDPAWYDSTNGSMGGNGHPVICLLARINEHNSAKDPIIYEPAPANAIEIIPYVRKNNNVATRNSYLVVDPGFFVYGGSSGGGAGYDFNYGFGTVMVNNNSNTTETVDLCIDLMADGSSAGIFDAHGTIEIGTTNDLYNAWLTGGSQGVNVINTQPTLFTVMNSNHACLENVVLPPHSNEQIGLRFNYNNLTLPPSPMQYRYQLSQVRQEEGNTVYGSNTIFIADVPNEAPAPPPMAKPADIEKIELENDLILSPNPTGKMLSIRFSNSTVHSGIVNVFDVSGKKVLSERVLNESSEIHLNVGALPTGTYSVKIINDDGKMSSTKFIKK